MTGDQYASAKDSARVVAYTDGACSGNPGPGGWGVVLIFGDTRKQLSGYAPQTTNNRMELQAAIEALRALKRGCHVVLHTDSKYVCEGMKQWMASWQKKGFKTAKGTPVKNQDLWMQLSELSKAHHVQWAWVRGHSGVEDNEYADRLAREAIARRRGL